jgi:hypothetical protein
VNLPHCKLSVVRDAAQYCHSHSRDWRCSCASQLGHFTALSAECQASAVLFKVSPTPYTYLGRFSALNLNTFHNKMTTP